jgi:hypothetical protein
MNQAEQTPAESFGKILTVTLIYCLSGTLLTLLNKLAILAFPFPNLLVVIQNLLAGILLSLGFRFFTFFGESPSLFDVEIIRNWLPLVLLFAGMLVSSLLSLLHVSAVTLIVIRTLSTVGVGVLEFAFFRATMSRVGVLSIVGIQLGSIYYGLHDLSFSTIGYVWLAVNIFCTSAYQIYVKHLVSKNSQLGPFGMSYINNWFSIPILGIVAFATGELELEILEYVYHKHTVSLIVVSGLLGFTLSVSAFAMNKLVSATSMMVANNVNKFAVIVLSELFVQRTLDTVASLGTLVVLYFGWLYSQARSIVEFHSWQVIVGVLLALLPVPLLFHLVHTEHGDVFVLSNSSSA